MAGRETGMNDPLVSIILRSFNEIWALRDTLAALPQQNYTHWELIAFDSGSTDGSVELIRAADPVHFVQIRPAEYNPSRVMNHGMRLARGHFCIFLNADATPQGTNWLRPLVEALFDPKTAAVFGIVNPAAGPIFSAWSAAASAKTFGLNGDSSKCSNTRKTTNTRAGAKRMDTAFATFPNRWSCIRTTTLVNKLTGAALATLEPWRLPGRARLPISISCARAVSVG
jgi:glycosyltransferase involved in cell wall biosynthesis